jgi:outer membrane phospholipase A
LGFSVLIAACHLFLSQGREMKISILFVIAILISIKSVFANSLWWTYNGTIPANAIKGSDEKESSKYICRAKHEKLNEELNEELTFSGEVNQGKCIILVNNKAIKKNEFEILINSVSKFKSYRPNYMVYVPREGDDPSQDDEHLEVFYSFKYRMTENKAFKCLDNNNYGFLAYTGKFDFYTDIFHETPDSRDSSPVINRLSNPELHYRVYLSPEDKQSGFFNRYIDFAFGHESNGQTLDVDSYEAFRDNTKDGVHFVDYISRGWDYWSFEYKLEYDSKSDCGSKAFSCLYGHFYTRKFISDGPLQGAIDDEIFWPTTINTDAQIENFDGLRLIFGKEHTSEPGNPPSRGYWITYRTGIRSAGKFNTFTINLRQDVSFFGLFEMPLYIKYFNGYGRELTTYHEKDTELSIGLQFR